MPSTMLTGLAALAALLVQLAAAQTCQTFAPTVNATMMDGYQSKVIMKGLKSPRAIVFDKEGNLLVVEQRVGLRYIKFAAGNEPCMASNKMLLNDTSLSHGVDISVDGKTIFVSSLAEVAAYPYNAAEGTLGAKKVLIHNLSNGGLHSSRTLLASQKVPGLLLVQRGSDGNIDYDANKIETGRSQFRIFNVTALMNSATPANYSAGEVYGWGMRNSVGMAENPLDGGVWSVENSVDEMMRLGKDVHSTNPGEELNYHGALADTKAKQRGANYGYPECYAAWDPSVLPNNTNIKVGTQFLIGDPRGNLTDDVCATRIAPRLTFAAHTAPLDIKFKKDGMAAYVTFHGSWNRSPPDGYRLSKIMWGKDGQPVEPSTSTNATINIMMNPQNTACPSGCFRPVGLAFDSKDRLFMSSDLSGEVFYVQGA